MGLLAARKKLHEQIGAEAIIVPKREFRAIQREIGLTDLVERGVDPPMKASSQGS